MRIRTEHCTPCLCLEAEEEQWWNIFTLLCVLYMDNCCVNPHRCFQILKLYSGVHWEICCDDTCTIKNNDNYPSRNKHK